MRPYFLLLLSALLFSCAESPQSEEQLSGNTPVEKQEFYPSFPMDSLKYLWANCDYIDVLYYDLPASMSIADSNSVRQMLSIIAAAPAPRHSACKPIGRLFFQVKGDNRASADLYFSDNCKFFVFLDGEKPRWGNLLTDRGVAYFQNNIGQILEMSKGIKPQGVQKRVEE